MEAWRKVTLLALLKLLTHASRCSTVFVLLRKAQMVFGVNGTLVLKKINEFTINFQ